MSSKGAAYQGVDRGESLEYFKNGQWVFFQRQRKHGRADAQ